MKKFFITLLLLIMTACTVDDWEVVRPDEDTLEFWPKTEIPVLNYPGLKAEELLDGHFIYRNKFDNTEFSVNFIDTTSGIVNNEAFSYNVRRGVVFADPDFRAWLVVDSWLIVNTSTDSLMILTREPL